LVLRAGVSRALQSRGRHGAGRRVFLKKQHVALQQIVQQTVAGLGYELVEIERSAGGLLRVTVDWPWVAGAPGQPSVGVDDCERVTRQLQYALEVEGVDYQRLEVSSPGIDRPLRHAGDFERFAGALIDITLKDPVGAAGQDAGMAANRKKFRGTLHKAEGGAWRIVWRDEPAAKPGQRVSARRAAAAPELALAFGLDELQSARLAAVVDFKGRKPQLDTGASPREQTQQAIF
jgi:ribosome maturation factor RimP